MRKRTYVAVYERDDHVDLWNVHIKGLKGCQTYGRSLRQAQQRIHEALALWLDKEPSELEIRDEFPPAFASVAEHVSAARQASDAAGARAQEEMAAAVRQLTELGLSRRDAAELLGLSHQRVQQLLAAS